jgi:hypothetical protein
MTGYGATLVGSTSGAMSGIKEITPPGRTLDNVEVATLGDTNGQAAEIPGGVVGGPLSVTLVSGKTQYATLYTAAKAKTSQTWTLTKTGHGVWAGAGVITELSEFDIATGADQTYRMTITPATVFAFTPAV